MNELDAANRLRAHLLGAPLPMGATLPWPRTAHGDVMVLAAVRMAGENLPWALAWGPPDGAPRVASVPDPRRLDDVRAMVLALAPDLLAHFGHPAFGDAIDPATRPLVTPGPTHIDMLHFLEYRYARAVKVPETEREAVNRVGRLCGWLFRESQRPAQVTVVDVTAATREAWSIPAEDYRQHHLGFVLAWLAPGDRATRAARAEAAEARAVATTLDPSLDEALEPHVSRWNNARRDGVNDLAAAQAIQEVVEDEVRRRWRLAAEGWVRLQGDPRPTSDGFATLAALAAAHYEHGWRAAEVRSERGDTFFVPDAETDRSAAAAAASFFAHCHAAERGEVARRSGDRDRVAEAVLSGRALPGHIAKVEDLGIGRTTLPHWTVDTAAEFATRLREGSSVEIARMPGRVGKIRSLTVVGTTRTLVVEITGRKTEGHGMRHAADPSHTREPVVLSPGASDLSQQKSFRVWRDDGPGAWLTHGAPRPDEDDRPRCQKDLVSLVEAIGAPR